MKLLLGLLLFGWAVDAEAQQQGWTLEGRTGYAFAYDAPEAKRGGFVGLAFGPALASGFGARLDLQLSYLSTRYARQDVLYAGQRYSETQVAISLLFDRALLQSQHAGFHVGAGPLFQRSFTSLASYTLLIDEQGNASIGDLRTGILSSDEVGILLRGSLRHRAGSLSIGVEGGAAVLASIGLSTVSAGVVLRSGR